MIAMQYSFTLPSDYDMKIIRHRIAEKGHLLDDFPRLHFKAYLFADRADAALPSSENLYAPFYLWHDSEGMSAFLAGTGFAALTRSFGWPIVQTWVPWQTQVAADLSAATCATRELQPIAAHTSLAALRRLEGEAVEKDVASGALASISAFDPTHWTLLRFRLWRELRPDLADDNRQLYHVGHVSHPDGHP
jgi:hypothetical protein